MTGPDKMTDHRHMKYQIQYQYKEPDAARPEDYGQIDELEHEAGELMLLPAVGDSVTLKLTGERLGAYRVLTRHFGYVV